MAAKKKGRKAAAKSAAPRKVPQPHGGALLSGGMPGNRGGTGRPPSELRARLRGSFEDRIKTLEAFADGAMPLREKCEKCGHEPIPTLAAMPVESSDRLRAIDMMAKYGLGTLKEVSVENVRERVKATLSVIQSHTAPEQYATIVQALKPVWA